jgi:hypothetical protein
MTVDADPFAEPDTGAPQREREAANAMRVRMVDLAEGRHVIIIGKEIGTKDGNPDDEGKPTRYEVITSDVIILDGRKSEKIPSFPHVVRDVWVTGRDVINELRAIWKNGPVVGFMTRNGSAYFLDKADPDVKGAKSTRDAYAAYKAEAQAPEPPF